MYLSKCAHGMCTSGWLLISTSEMSAYTEFFKGVPCPYQYTPLGKVDCNPEHEFVMIMSVRLEYYQYTPISHDLLTLRSVIFPIAVWIHGKSLWKGQYTPTLVVHSKEQ